MNTYKDKYLKYKKKYLALKYGGNGFDAKKRDIQNKRKKPDSREIEEQDINYSLKIERIKISTDIKKQYVDKEIKDFKITENFKISNIPDQLDIKCIGKNVENNNCKNFDEQYLKSLLTGLTNLYTNKKFIDIRVKYVQKIISNPDEKFIIIGDIHCDLVNFKLILENLRTKNIINDDFKIIDEKYKIIFLGDMVDYGLYGIETVMIILLLKIKNFNNVYIISGNHEQECVYTQYDLSKEIKIEITDREIADLFENFLKLLPVAIFLKYKNDTKYYQFCHGGVPIEYINDKNNIDFIKFLNNDKIKKMRVSQQISEGFLWHDFINGENSILEGQRMKICSSDIIKYKKKYNIHSIISGHQDLASLSFQISNNEEGIYRNSHIYNEEIIGKLSELKDNINIILDPTKDFLSIITSNAVTKILKDIIKHIERMLEIKNYITKKTRREEEIKIINDELDTLVKFFNVKGLNATNIIEKIEYMVDYVKTNILQYVTPNYLVLLQDIPKKIHILSKIRKPAEKIPRLSKIRKPVNKI